MGDSAGPARLVELHLGLTILHRVGRRLRGTWTLAAHRPPLDHVAMRRACGLGREYRLAERIVDKARMRE